MTSMLETIRHYQRSIDRFVGDEARLLHCLHRLNKLSIDMKYLQETRIGKTVNNLRKHEGVVGHTATVLVAKWKRKVEAETIDKDQRLHTDDTENIEPSTRNNYTHSSDNGTSTTPNSDSRDETIDKSLIGSCSSDNSKSSLSGKSQKRSSPLKKKSSKNCNEKMLKLDQSSSSISISNAEREKRKDCGKSNDKKRRRESDLIDIDSKMGTSFAEALKMLDVAPPSKAKKVLNSSLYKTSTSNKCKKSGVCSSFDETPILLTKRPLLEPSLDIVDEILSSSTVTELKSVECVFRQPQKQSIQPTDEETISYSMISRKTKTKVFSGNKAGFKYKVPTLFDMCIDLLQDNVDLLEFTGGVPFDILRPVLERTTCEQLMILEDYNPYLMEDTNCLWEQHCKRRFRTRSREELETWREMYIRCIDEERAKFNSLTASIKLSKERLTKPTYVDTHMKATKNTKANQMVRLSQAGKNKSPVDESGSQDASKSKDSNQIRKRSKKSNDDPDWTPTTWYKTLHKKIREPKPPKPPIKKTIDMLRYDRAKALEKKKEEWKQRP